MALVLKDRVKETTTTTGTGTLTLAGAATGFDAFSEIGNGNTTYYVIAHQTADEWEVGLGTYTLSGTTLARTTVLASSNSGSATDFSAGTKDVFCSYPAGKSVNLDANGDVTISTGFLRATETEASNGIMANATTVSANYTVPTNYNALSAGPISIDSGITVTINSGSVWTIV
tara:strand:+ start:246 stop:764 length:519 start_codon:yes stop_codon:yes gene_type:complete